MELMFANCSSNAQSVTCLVEIKFTFLSHAFLTWEYVASLHSLRLLDCDFFFPLHRAKANGKRAPLERSLGQISNGLDEKSIYDLLVKVTMCLTVF